MRIQRKYTVKEWRKLQNLQESLCKRYDVILTNHKTKKERIIEIIEKINLKNINIGIETFNKIIQDFGGSMEQLSSELSESPKNNVKIWSNSPKKEPKSQKSKDEINLEKIWGSKK